MGSINNLGDQTLIGALDNGHSTPAARNHPAAQPEDQVQIATIPPTAQVEQLRSTNPGSFQSVVSNAIRELRAAVFQSADPIEAAYLSSLANRFQRLEESGGAFNPAQSFS